MNATKDALNKLTHANISNFSKPEGSINSTVSNLRKIMEEMIDLVTMDTSTPLIRGDKGTTMEVKEYIEKKPTNLKPGKANILLGKQK